MQDALCFVAAHANAELRVAFAQRAVDPRIANAPRPLQRGVAKLELYGAVGKREAEGRDEGGALDAERQSSAE